MKIIEELRKEIYKLNDLNKMIAQEQKEPNPFLKGITAGYADVLCLLKEFENKK